MVLLFRRKKSCLFFALARLAPNETGIISQRQPGADITYRLWTLGLGPAEAFKVTKAGKQFTIEVNGEEIILPDELAEKVSVEKVEA